jgi:ABC-2 type transport system ATP-binding protein
VIEVSIKAQGLYKSFGTHTVLQDVSLQVATGEIYGLVGPDGAGKTTTLRLLCGALHPDKGEIVINQYNLAHQVEQARAQIGYLSQRFSLYEDLTVMENIRFFAELRGLVTKAWLPRSQEILAFVGLDEFSQRRASFLSGGMRQKLGLAIALVNQPKVLLLDEPTTGVDPLTRQDFWQLIIRLAAGGQVAVLISTPYMDEAARCTHIGFLRAGRMVAAGTPRQLCSLLADQIVVLSGQPQMLLQQLAQRDPDVLHTLRFGDRLHLRLRPGQTDTAIARLGAQIAAAGGQVERLEPIPAQLEDVFVALAEENQA